MTVMENGIGASPKRREDFRFLKGLGRYTDDMTMPNMTHCVFVRSPVAHAKLGRIDLTAALKSAGVVAIFTAADLEADNVGGVPCGWLVTGRENKPMVEPKHSIMASGKVRHVGDPVVAVIAETLEQAKDAAEKVSVDYQELPAIVDMKKALKGGGTPVHDEAANNMCFDWELGDKAATDAAFAKAAHICKIDLINQRLVANAMEPRAAIGAYDLSTEEHTLVTTSQNPHVIRLLMGAFVLNIPEHKLRVLSPDVGGGFGSKIFH